VILAAEALGGSMIEQKPSPVTGAKGNVEYLIKVVIPGTGG
jgi:predicted rRNA methylase YqxC with S4 and FtsJ domains